MTTTMPRSRNSDTSRHLRALRLEQGLRQRDVAARVGVTDHQIRKWERGLAIPPPSAIQALAELFGVPPSSLGTAQRVYARVAEAGEGYLTASAQGRSVERSLAVAPSDRLRTFDLFCGAGGLAFGLELTGRFVTIAGLDLLPDRMATFRANHPHATALQGDVREFSVEQLRQIVGDVDVMVGGPPCQGFSSIRPFRTLTEGDKRNTLIEHFVLMISGLQPRWFVFENVLGILTHKKGRVLKSLIEGFEECGYRVSYRVLNAALYGVPQNRERLFVVGSRTNADYSWPRPTHRTSYRGMAGNRTAVVRTSALLDQGLPHAVSLMDAVGDLPPLCAGGTDDRYSSPPMNAYQEWVRGQCGGPTMHEATRHSPRMLNIIRHSGRNKSSIPPHLITSGFSSCYSRLAANDPSTTITVNFVHPASNRCIHPFQDRALTPREGARIQSFPDSFEFRGTRAQIVKQIGNAVPPLLACAVGNSIYDADRKSQGNRASSP